MGRVITQLAEYYDALGTMTEREQTERAETHADDSTVLAYQFHQSIRTVESREAIEEPFYDSGRKDPGSPVGREIDSTIAFASYLSGGRPCTVKGDEALAFRYIDREMFPGRTRRKEGRVARRSLDLLLANSHDQLPVFAELKRGRDRPAYFALVQVLMLAAEFQSAAQRRRLLKHEGAENLSWPPEGPFADVYIIAFDPPTRGKYRKRSFHATKRISESLIADDSFARCIRRIAYLEAAVATSGEMAFTKHFAFGPGLLPS